MNTITSYQSFRSYMDQLLVSPEPHKKLRCLAEQNILQQFFPELDALRGVEQPERWHPEGDVFEHTLLMLSHMVWPTPLLGWCILMHDIGKKAAQTFDEDGIPHFYGHEAVGADMAEEILKRLHLPNAVIASVVPAVRNHMRFARVDEMKPAKWKRIIADPNFAVELELHRIDCISCHAFLNNYLLMLDRMREMELEGREAALPPPLLNGKDLIGMGMKPGVAMGILLREITDLQLNGQLNSREEALAYAREKYIPAP